MADLQINFNFGKEGTVNFEEQSGFFGYEITENKTTIKVQDCSEEAIIMLPQFFDVYKEGELLVGWTIGISETHPEVYTSELCVVDLKKILGIETITKIGSIDLVAVWTTMVDGFNVNKDGSVSKDGTKDVYRKLSDTINGEYYFNKLTDKDLKFIAPKQKTVFLGLQLKDSVNDIEKFGSIDFSGKTLDDMLKLLNGTEKWKETIKKQENTAIIWSRNDNILQSYDIINHNDFILAQFFDVADVKLVVLPCVYGMDENKSNGIVTSDGSIAATNYGTTYIYSKGDNKVAFNSDNVANTEAPNPVVGSKLGDKYIICAVPKQNCIFVGWYRRIITDGGVNYSQITNTQQIEITIDSNPLCQYAAVFAAYGDVSEEYKNHINFPNE